MFALTFCHVQRQNVGRAVWLLGFDCGSQTVVPGPVASVSPGKFRNAN